MIKFDYPEKRNNVLLIGVGSLGTAIVDNLSEMQLKDVDFALIDRDSRLLCDRKLDNKYILSPYDIEKPNGDKVDKLIQSISPNQHHIYFIVADICNNYATAATLRLAEHISDYMKDNCYYAIFPILVKPIGFGNCEERGDIGMADIRSVSTNIFCINSDRMLRHEDLTISDAYHDIDMQVRNIVSSFTSEGFFGPNVYIDFADILTILDNGEQAKLLQTYAEGEKRDEEAIGKLLGAIRENGIEPSGLKELIFTVTYHEENQLTMDELYNIIDPLRNSIHPESSILWGAVVDNSIKPNSLIIKAILVL